VILTYWSTTKKKLSGELDMKLNALERSFIVSPVRALLQNFEAKVLLKFRATVIKATVLDIGCGPGFAVDLLYRSFDVSHVDAFDLDENMATPIP